MTDHRELPTLEVVIRDGSPIWRVCGMGLCVEHQSGQRAQEAFRALCRAKGMEPPEARRLDGPGGPPVRGPSEVDEPGV